MRKLNQEEVAYREHSDKLEVVPGKVVRTINAPDGRKKCRTRCLRESCPKRRPRSDQDAGSEPLRWRCRQH